MIISSAKYVTGASNYSHCIASELPQIAVVGKSNVGKSSFINYLVNDGKLARTSKQPGRTRLINYFVINENKADEFLLTDLPGYGFARVSNAEKAKWAQLMEDYLAKEKQIKQVLFLVDIRHEPTADDKLMYNYLFHNNLPFTIIATKADKISRSQINVRKSAIASTFKLGANNIIAVSAEKKQGKEQVLEKLEQVLNSLKINSEEQFTQE